MLNCIFCQKACKNLNSKVNHERLCKHNPKRQVSSIEKYNLSHSPPWNKGLTKNTNKSIARQAKSIMKPRPTWQLDVDDDKKVYQKYLNKKHNAELENIGFSLSFFEFCNLIKKAGLLSSQLGFSGQNYVLARYEDKGDYSYANCRFITQKENSDEKYLHLSLKKLQEGK